MSTRRAIRSTRTNRCGAPATRRPPASACRRSGPPKLRVHTILRRQLPGQGGRRRIVHSPRASGGRWVATKGAAGRRCRNSGASSIGLPERRSVGRRASGVGTPGRRDAGTPGLLWKMQRSGSQGNLFAFLGNISYFCRVSADRPPPRRITPADAPPHLRGAIRTQLFNRTKTIRPQCVCRPEPAPKSPLPGRNGRRILSAWR